MCRNFILGYWNDPRRFSVLIFTLSVSFACVKRIRNGSGVSMIFVRIYWFLLIFHQSCLFRLFGRLFMFLNPSDLNTYRISTTNWWTHLAAYEKRVDVAFQDALRALGAFPKNSLFSNLLSCFSKAAKFRFRIFGVLVENARWLTSFLFSFWESISLQTWRRLGFLSVNGMYQGSLIFQFSESDVEQMIHMRAFINFYFCIGMNLECISVHLGWCWFLDHSSC